MEAGPTAKHHETCKTSDEWGKLESSILPAQGSTGDCFSIPPQVDCLTSITLCESCGIVWVGLFGTDGQPLISDHIYTLKYRFINENRSMARAGNPEASGLLNPG